MLCTPQLLFLALLTVSVACVPVTIGKPLKDDKDRISDFNAGECQGYVVAPVLEAWR